MIIATHQLVSLGKIREDDFVQRSIVFLKNNFPDWVGEKNDDDLSQFIRDVIEFGNEYNIHEELSLQKLMFLEIQYPFMQSKMVKPDIQEILTYPDRPEELKINYLHKQLIFDSENTL